MFSRLLSAPLLLGAAVGVPYLATQGPNIDGLLSSRPASATAAAPSDVEAAALQKPPTALQPSPPQGPGATLYPTETPLEGLPALSLGEVFNFQVSKEWVYQRWARKSTALSELGLFGIRVPLVTGTQLYDLAGSLTYFFDNDGRVRRIAFHGTTGDTTPLVRLASQQYGLRQHSPLAAGEQLFQIRRQSHVFSELRTRPAAVLWASSPHDSFAVNFDLQRPGVATPLPSRLPPLPAFQAPPAAQTQQPVAVQREKKADSAARPAKPVDPKEAWKPFFPRSRVPVKQVDGLERSGRLW